MTSQHPPERPSTRRSAPVEPARKPVPVGHRRPAIARRSARLRPGVFGLVVALSTVAGWLFSSTSMVWLGSQLLFPDVAVTADVSLGNTDTVDLLEYRVSAGHSRGPPANVDEPRSTQHTYYVIAGDTPVLVHNCGNEIGKQVDPFDGGDLNNAVHNQRLADGARGRGGNYGAARLDDGSIITGRSGANWHAEDDLINQAGDRGIVDLYTERAPCAASCQGKLGGVNVTWAFPWNGSNAAETAAIRAASSGGIKSYIRALFG